MSSDLDRRALDEPASRPTVVSHYLFWPIIIAVGLVVYEITAEAGLGSAIACTKFGWDDILTAFYFRRKDGNRGRGLTCFWLFLAAGMWKIAITGSLVFFSVGVLAGAFKNIQPGMTKVILAGLFVMLAGFALSALATGRSLYLARRNRVKLWLDWRLHRDRESQRWPPRLSPMGRINRAGGVIMTAIVIWLLVFTAFTIFANHAIGQGLLPALFGQRFRNAGLLVILPMLWLGFPVFILICRDVVYNRFLARYPSECWPESRES